MQHGAVGKRTVEDKYEVLTSCPVGLDEAGTGFTPMDGDFCGKSTSEMGWSDYLLIHASMLRIVRATGGYWFSASHSPHPPRTPHPAGSRLGGARAGSTID